MNILPWPGVLRILVLIGFGVGLSGCGGSGGTEGGAQAVEQHVVAAEEFGVMLADIQTKADLDRAKPQLTKQAQALAETLVAMNKAVLDNASLGEAEKMAAISAYQMRLAEAERLWRSELQRIAASLDPSLANELRTIVTSVR
jgi:hypothetical protein